MKTRLLTALGFMTLVVFLRFGGTAVATPAAPYTPYGDNWLYFTNGNAIQSLAMEGSTLWVGTEGGVVRWDVTTGQYVKYTTADGLADNDVLAVAVDGAGSKWFGTGSGGVSRFDGVTWTTYTTADGLTSDFVLSIAIDSAGNKWFGTNYGVSKFDGTTWTTYTEADGLVYNMVRAIATWFRWRRRAPFGLPVVPDV